MASEWQTAFVVSHKMPWCALLTAVKNYNKVLKNCKTFSSRPRPRPNVQDQDFMIQDQDFHFCPWGTSRPRPWSRGLHHCQHYVMHKQLKLLQHHQRTASCTHCLQLYCLHCQLHSITVIIIISSSSSSSNSMTTVSSYIWCMQTQLQTIPIQLLLQQLYSKTYDFLTSGTK